MLLRRRVGSDFAGLYLALTERLVSAVVTDVSLKTSCSSGGQLLPLLPSPAAVALYVHHRSQGHHCLLDVQPSAGRGLDEVDLLGLAPS